MPITLLDVILLGVMLVSALLAMIRGFMREVLEGETAIMCVPGLCARADLRTRSSRFRAGRVCRVRERQTGRLRSDRRPIHRNQVRNRDSIQ